MQAVILAGGMGTRLGPLTKSVPKAMVSFSGHPFLEYQLDLLRRQGVGDIVLCIGYQARMIQAYFGDGRLFGVKICYSVERDGLLGTAGAVKKAEPLLEEVFFLTYGDAYLLLDYRAVLEHFWRHGGKRGRGQGALGVMVVFRNEDRYDRSNVIVEDGLVKVYDKQRRLSGMDHINYGVSLLHRESLTLVPAGVPYSQEEWYQRLIERGELLAFETEQRFYEIGSPRGLEEFEELVAAGALP